MDIKEILKKHLAWLRNEENGKRAVLTDAILTGAVLADADLTRAVLTNADLRGAVLTRTFLTDADLRGAELGNADLRGAVLTDAVLRGADLRGAILTDAVLRGADLRGAILTGAVLRGADLRGAVLTRTFLTDADLTDTDLGGSKGLLTAREFMGKFKHDKLGVIVYKLIGNTYYESPDYWNMVPGSFLEEVVNPLPTLDCACGVNFATLEWCQKDSNYSRSKLWKCRIRWIDLTDVVVPYNTDGKARCGRLELLEIVSKDQVVPSLMAGSMCA